jgi:putative SOS response-associated peptidase YedK
VCGRFTLTERDLASLARAWAAEVGAAVAAGWQPRYNVAPGDRHLLLRAGSAGRVLEPATFGLPGPGGALLINARVETAATRPAFREAWRTRRGAVPTDGFYEWEGPAGARRPTWFHPGDARPFLLAALWGEAADGGAGFVILTAAANAEVARLHGRMPLVLPEDRLTAWLAGPPPPVELPRDGLFTPRPVSPRVNAVANDDPECLAPAGPDAQLRLL